MGNVLLGDEGFGVHAVRRLEQEGVPERVDLEDGATAGVDLIERIASYDRVIVIDALRLHVPARAGDAEWLEDRGSGATGGSRLEGEIPSEPGSGDVVVFRLSNVEIENTDPHLSLHGCSLGGLIRLARSLEIALPEIVVVGFVPPAIGWSTELSSRARSGLEEAVARVRELL